MSGKPHILVDSDAFVGWCYPEDAHHYKAIELFEVIKKARLLLMTTSWVIAETATVLSRRDGQQLARSFFKQVREIRFPIIHIDEDLQQETVTFFEQQEKRGTSMVDCSNLIVMRRFQIPTIFSFDKFYRNHPDIQTTDLIGLV